MWGETAVPTNLTAADAIWGTSVTDFYVGDSDGALFHFNGSGYGQGFQDPANAGITSVYESPTGKVYVAGSELYSCSSQCTTNTNFAAPANYGTLGCTVTAVCGYEETVYGVGNEGNGPDGPVGCLLSTDGQGNWTSLTLSALAGGANSCAVAPSGTTFIGGAGGIINYSPLNGATAEVINWPAGTNGSNVYVTFAAMWTDGTNAFAAGGTRRIFQRTSAGWNLILNNSPIDPNTDGNSDASFAAMAGAGGDVYAFGDDMSTHQAAYYDGQTLAWTYLPSSIEPNTFLWAAWAADANNYFVVGSHDGNDAAIFHGHH